MNDTPVNAPRKRRYAQGTNVSNMQSRMEIERTIMRFDAQHFTTYQGEKEARIGFEIRGRKVMFVLQMPERETNGIATYKQGAFWVRRTESAIEAQYEQAKREKWRALALYIKAKLAAVDAGITTVEEEFLAQTIVPTEHGAATVAEVMNPQIDQAYESGVLPAGLNLLALGPGK